MSVQQSHPVDPANIIAFIVSDPLSVGFAAIRAAHPGADQPLADAANSTTGPGSGTLPAGQISKLDFDDLINGTDFGNLTSPQLESLTYLTAGGSIDIGSAVTQAKLASLFSGLSTTKAAMAAAGVRPASPAEIYFAAGTVITNTQLDQARNSGSGNNF